MFFPSFTSGGVVCLRLKLFFLLIVLLLLKSFCCQDTQFSTDFCLPIELLRICCLAYACFLFLCFAAFRCSVFLLILFLASCLLLLALVALLCPLFVPVLLVITAVRWLVLVVLVRLPNLPCRCRTWPSCSLFLGFTLKEPFCEKPLQAPQIQVFLWLCASCSNVVLGFKQQPPNGICHVKRCKNRYFRRSTRRALSTAISFLRFSIWPWQLIWLKIYGKWFWMCHKTHSEWWMCLWRLKHRVSSLYVTVSWRCFSAENRAFDNGTGVGFDDGAAMLYNMKAPVSNAQTVHARNPKLHFNRHLARTQNWGGKRLFPVLNRELQRRKWARFCTYESNWKSGPKIEACSMHIYIYIYIRVMIWAKFRGFKGLLSGMSQRLPPRPRSLLPIVIEVLAYSKTFSYLSKTFTYHLWLWLIMS